MERKPRWHDTAAALLRGAAAQRAAALLLAAAAGATATALADAGLVAPETAERFALCWNTAAPLPFPLPTFSVTP